jgi:hypothetical protein
VRTTVNIDDEVLERAKALAQARQLTLGEVISDGLRTLLYSNSEEQKDKNIRLVTFRGNGTCPGVDLDSNDSLLNTMEST